MGLQGLEDKASAFVEEESGLVSAEEKEELGADFYRTLKSACTVKYYV